MVGALQSLFRWIKDCANLPARIAEINNFQRISVEDIKRQITNVEKRMDELNGVLGAMSDFDRRAVEDVKRQVVGVELRLDDVNGQLQSITLDGKVTPNDLRNEFANIRLGQDRQAAATLRLASQVDHLRHR